MPKGLSIEEIESEIRKAASRFPFIQDTKTLLKTAHTIKIRLNVSEECYIQIYRNIQKNLASYVAILGCERIYGRDCDGGLWHRHREDDPSGHDFSPEGSREIDLDEFLSETQEILIEKGIL